MLTVNATQKRCGFCKSWKGNAELKSGGLGNITFKENATGECTQFRGQSRTAHGGGNCPKFSISVDAESYVKR
jgi:hypothetical protein